MAYPVPTRISYAEEFRQAVIAANPDREDIQQLVNEGNCGQLGLNLLQNVERSTLSNADVIKHLQAGQADVLLEMALAAQRHRQVYIQWREYDRRHNNGPGAWRP